MFESDCKPCDLWDLLADDKITMRGAPSLLLGENDMHMNYIPRSTYINLSWLGLELLTLDWWYLLTQQFEGCYLWGGGRSRLLTSYLQSLQQNIA